MGLGIAYRGAGKWACALVKRHHGKTRFCSRDRAPCMRITMAMRDWTIDVTSTPVDVSNRVMDMAWFSHACKSRRSTARRALATQRRENTTQHIGKASLLLPNVQDSAQLPSEDEEACRQVPRED